MTAEMEQDKLKTAADASASGELTFDKMTLVQRIKAIDSVLDSDIRPMLVMDGGNMEIIDIKENLPHYDLYIRYLGSCSGCSSGSSGTLYAIESVLQQKIDENLRVLPI
jgi:NifU-like protein